MELTQTKYNILSENLTGEKLLNMVMELISNGSDSFEEFEVIPFDEEGINERFSTPYDAIQAYQRGKFNPTHSYIRFDGYENIETLDLSDLYSEAEDRTKDIITEYFDEELLFDDDEVMSLLVDNAPKLIEEERKLGTYDADDWENLGVEQV